EPGRDPPGGPVRGPRLRGRPQVKLNPGRHGQGLAFQVDLAPAGHLPYREGERRPGWLNLFEITIVSYRGHGRAHRRVYVAVGQAGRPQRHGDGLGQQRAELSRATLDRPQGADFRVGAEPAAGQVHLGEVGRQQAPGLGQAPRVGHHQLDQGPEGTPAGRRVDVRGLLPAGAWHHEPPEVAWLLPELDVGEEPEPRPLELELLELLELEEDEPELVEPEPELVELEPDEPEFELDDPEFVELEPVEDEPV